MSAPSLTAAELELLHTVLDLARAGQTAELAGAIDAGVPVNLTSPAGDPLLTLAAYHCHPDTVEMLLGRGADTGRVNDRGQTALAAAVFRREPLITAMLLAAGADPSAGAPSASEVAAFFGLADMAAQLGGGNTEAAPSSLDIDINSDIDIDSDSDSATPVRADAE